MTVEQISPLSCVIFANGGDIDESDNRDEAIEAGYSNIYIVTPDDVYLEKRLQAGRDGRERYARVKVHSIPGRKIDEYKARCKDPIEEAFSFLPDGKVPFKLFLTIKQFFLDVIQVKKSAVEAMIWVMWNEEVGYFLHVPKQSVSGGSVVYQWDDLPPNSMIVVDIHSHGSMSAFFSGTDDRDDLNTIRYSGVIGKNTTTPEWKFRFNCMSKKHDMQLLDVFDSPPMPTAEVDPEWLDRVDLNVPTVHSYKPGKYERKQNQGQQGNFNGHHVGPSHGGIPMVYRNGVLVPYDDVVPGPNNPKCEWKEGKWQFRATHANAEFPSTGQHNLQSSTSAQTDSSPKKGEGPLGTSTGTGVAPTNNQPSQLPQLVRNVRPQSSPSTQSQTNPVGVVVQGNPIQRSFSDLDAGFGIDDDLEAYFAGGGADRQAELMHRLQNGTDVPSNEPDEGVTLEGLMTSPTYRAIFPDTRFIHGNLMPIEEEGENVTDDEAVLGSTTAGVNFPQLVEIKGQHISGDSQEEAIPEFEVDADGITYHVPEHDVSPNFDVMAANHGIQAAVAAAVVSKATEHLIPSPDILRGALQEMFQVVEEERKLETFRSLLPMLSDRDQEKLSHQGF